MRNEFAKVSDPNSFFTCAGEVYRTLYAPKVDKEGRMVIVASGRENTKEKINSYRECTDMAYILRQIALGNESVLHVQEGFYADLTNTPKTLGEFLQLQIDARTAFEKLPLETRNKFDNDFHVWLATSGNEEWCNKMGFVNDSVAEVEEKEVNNDVHES